MVTKHAGAHNDQWMKCYICDLDYNATIYTIRKMYSLFRYNILTQMSPHYVHLVRKNPNCPTWVDFVLRIVLISIEGKNRKIEECNNIS